MRPFRAIFLLFVGLLAPITLSSCGESDPTSNDPPDIVLVPGRNTGVAGQRMIDPVRFRVVDSGGNPKSGVTVAFTLVTGGGALSADSARSDAQGYAVVDLTMDPRPQILHQIDATIPGTTGLAQFFGLSRWPIFITPDTLHLAGPGARGAFQGRLKLPSGEERTGTLFDYSISDSTLASLEFGFGTGTYSGQGRVVRALRPGTARVIATHEGVADTAWIVVANPDTTPD